MSGEGRGGAVVVVWLDAWKPFRFLLSFFFCRNGSGGAIWLVYIATARAR